MICRVCHGRGHIFTDEMGLRPCHECGGAGVVYCCDEAGSTMQAAWEAALRGDLAERDRLCDAAKAAVEADYRDDSFPERACDRCGTLYRGPAVYCSLKCALADA